MRSGYFHRVTKETPTRLWINNPTSAEVEQAIAAGAISCTTNPTYCARLIDVEPDSIRGIIDRTVREVDDDAAAAERVYGQASWRLMEQFLPLYEASGGTHGFVTIQGDPRRDDDAEFIVEEALRHARLGRNFLAKIPVIISGARAIPSLVARDIPICATEVFGVAQAIFICEAYQRATRETGHHPPFYVTHISGIFDEYLAGYVQREGVDIAPGVLAQAGCAIAREEYRILKERGYAVTMLAGGAQGTQHFTEMVGGDAHVTINWSTARQIIEADGPVVNRMDAQAPRAVLDELGEKLPDFRRGFAADGLAPEEFKEFGPLQLFRNRFIAGYTRLVGEVAARRAQLLLV